MRQEEAGERQADQEDGRQEAQPQGPEAKDPGVEQLGLGEGEDTWGPGAGVGGTR